MYHFSSLSIISHYPPSNSQRFMNFLYKELFWFQISHPRSLLTVFKLFTFQTHFSLSKPSLPRDFRPILASNHMVWPFYLSFFMHFMHLDLGFGFEKFLSFSKLMNVLCNFWVGCYLIEFKTSCIASHEHCNNVSCIIDVCFIFCNVVCW